jgi:hypothetical protein
MHESGYGTKRTYNHVRSSVALSGVNRTSSGRHDLAENDPELTKLEKL